MDKVRHNSLSNIKVIVPFFIAFTLFLSSESVAQQKVQFTQYMFNGLVINPAYAGADEALSLTFIHRNQWAGVEGAPTTQILSGHTLFKNKKVGLGLILSNDEIGVHRNLNFVTNYAYHLTTGSSSYLSFGLQAGIHDRRSDYGSLIGDSGNDPNINDASISHTFFDFGAGLYYRSPRLHVGFSIPEIIPQQMYFNDTLSTKFSEVNNFFYSRYRIYLNDDMDLEPSLLLKYLYGVPLSYDMNMNVIYRKVLTMGLSYRRNESFDFLLKCQVTPQLQIGYSYDYPLQQTSELYNASHEVMIHYLFRFNESNVTSPR
jgi:type IX secretion system PorP/SprF family membrane protein